MKKGKVVSLPSSIGTQIRTRARNLPIDRCYVNRDWKEIQMAHAVVSRKHVNGNVTFGFYLVDLMLLGVKDCFYAFNESPAELDERLNNGFMEFVECDYALVHNIVYTGIAFAEDYGFEPVKDFTGTGIFIMEEDSDDFPEMDIPLGEDGVPVVFITPDNNRQHDISVLEKTAGSGNFIVYHVDDEGIVEEDDEYDDELSNDYDDAINEIIDMGVDDYAAEYKDNLTPVQILALTDVAYQLRFDEPDLAERYKISDLILNDARFDFDLERLPGTEPYVELLQSIVNKLVDDEDAAMAEMEALMATHPDEPDLGIFHINLARDLYQSSEVERLTKYWYDRASDHYVVRLMYAEWLAEQEHYDEMFELFGNQPGLDALTTEDLPFTDVMVAEFCACHVLAWLSKDRIDKAEPYYRILLVLDHMTSIIKNALLAMMAKKQDALVEKIQGKAGLQD